ncbi:hypothetical protein GW17_00057889 [Ensete ventricosum]|nr:hypothetical protein GW17_00057889 [Ensete ventricosum]
MALKWLRRGAVGSDEQRGHARKRKQGSSEGGGCSSKDGRGGWAALEGAETTVLDPQAGRVSKAKGVIKAAVGRGGRKTAAAITDDWQRRRVMARTIAKKDATDEGGEESSGGGDEGSSNGYYGRGEREEQRGSGRSYIPVFQIRMEKMKEVSVLLSSGIHTMDHYNETPPI